MTKSTKSTHTHKGNCQACGRLQAVDNVTGHVAKHGYNVEHGYFQGTCPGSGEQPLQIERTLTDWIINSMREQAIEAKKLLKKLESGKAHPATVQKFEDTGRRTMVKDEKTGIWDVVMIPWAEANEHARKASIEKATWETESKIRFCERHAKDMTELAARIHGTALPLAIQEKAPKAPEAVVDVKAAKVTGTFQTKQARKDALESLNRQYGKLKEKIQDMYLAIPYAERNGSSGRQTDLQKLQNDVYYGWDLHVWKPKHSAMVLKAFPQAAEIVKEIEVLAKAREAVKNAP